MLATVQRAIEQQQAIIATTRELKRSLMHKLFTEGLRGEAQKPTEIGLVPESWDVVPLASSGVEIEYGLSKAIPKNKPDGGIKIVSTADITKDGGLLYGQIRYIECPEKSAAILKLKEGDVLFNWRNSPELIGKSAIYSEQDEAHIFASFILRIRCDETLSHNHYLKHLFNWYRGKGVFIQLARRAVNQANYNKNEISVLKIPRPKRDEQVEIADALNLVDDTLATHQRKLEGLQEMFKTLLHQLMTAQLRVNDLDLDALGVPALD